MGFFREQWEQIRGNLKWDILKAMAIAGAPWALSLILHPPDWAAPVSMFVTSLALLVFFNAKRADPARRMLTRKQRANLIRALSARRGGEIAVDSITSDIEALRFAEQLAGVFAEAGWSVTPPMGATRLTTTRVGTVLFFDDTQGETAAFVASALSGNGIDCVPLNRDREASKPPQLVVASRNIP
jgi:hypothetical protein